MTEEQTTATPQDGSDGQAQAAAATTTTTTTTPDTGRASEPGSVDALPKWAQSIIGDLRKENANRRKAVEQADEQKKRDEEAAAAKAGEWQTVAEKARAERDEERKKREDADLRVRDRITRTEVRSAAVGLNAVDADDVYALLDKGAVQYDDAGEPTNIKPLVEDLLKAKPHLVKPAEGGGYIPATARGGNLTPQQAVDANVQAHYEALKRSGRYVA